MSSGKNHKARCNRIAHRPPLRAAQGGFAFMVMLVLLVVGSLTLYTQGLNQSTSQTARNDMTRTALADAKQALIAWSAEYEYRDDDDLPRRSGGHLPCPDTDNDGDSEGAACGGAATRIGRLPWKTLKTTNLRDSSGEPLWYALSPNFRNSKTLPVNSDSQGVFSISGALNAENVIAVIFAPGAALSGQSRTSFASLTNWVNYLEGADFQNNVIVTQAPGEISNDQIAVITAADLFPAVERRVEEGIRESLIPMMNYYQEQWSLARNAATAMSPFPAAFAPTADENSLCGDTTLTQGLLPMSDCGMSWGTVEIVGATGTCKSAYEREEANKRAFTLPSGAMGALGCTMKVVVFAGDDDDDDDDDDSESDADGDDDNDATVRTKRVTIRVTLKNGARTLAMPLTKDYITHTGAQPWNAWTYSKPRLDESGRYSDIKVTYNAYFRAQVDDDDDDGVTLNTTAILPIYRVDKQYALAKQGLDKKSWAKLNPGWYFDNEWYRVTYYATTTHLLPCDVASGTCPTKGDLLKVTRNNETTEHEMLLLLAGHGIRGAVRPSNSLQNYLEQKKLNAENPAAGTTTFEQVGLSRQFNDRIISVLP